ncbi:hypothetical protein AGABI1DRAFT_105521 [Agaricus bisporus var. burnettii JB137-S8]|uniref:Uncharacterized protein n=1 Tax=Agaricus bisporus var. burnettii (strain JB137-S8 / ATCC MYA-4627 / FGSC 10392) TaxID=597362 RepID=K5XFN4_AGABU|nr:uncharacterized protein AGABI1DRAFT_105521 [Agaricus bisporus var. burnettii JB137-S8]EKM82213.1 hypothetical protein AGABI1DRAFT_105521 [Agaricus bisporus var. burnettii JB137-S8]
MEKSGRYIWKQVYERLYESGNPPPRCPEDINLAQYTRFLYHKRCMVCDTRIGHHTSWMMRLRACHHCLTNTALFSTYRYTSEGLLSIRSKKSSFVWKSELEEIKEGRGPSANERYKLRAVRMEGTREFDEWEERCADSQSADLERRRTERKDAIMKKLEEIGWKESYIRDLNCGSMPFGLPGFGISKKLTKKDWEAIEFEIVHRLSDLEHQNLPRLKQRRLQTRWRLFETKFNEWNQNQTSPEWSFRPRLADISILEPFRTVIFCSSDRDEIHYDFKMEDIDRVAKEWMASRDSYIFSLLPQDLQDLYQGYKPSLPPLAIFRFCGLLHGTIDLICASRENALSYPLSLELDPQDRDIYKTLIKLASSSPPLCPWNWNWHNRDFIFDIKAYRITIDILEFLGMDPYTTTVAETALFKQTQFRCFMCKNPWLPLNSFELMIEHDLLCHDNPEDEQMLPVSERWITAVDTIASDFQIWSNEWQKTEYHSIFLE